MRAADVVRTVFLLTLITLLGSGCAGSSLDQESSQGTEEKIQLGNTISNLDGGGYIAHQGDWVYRCELVDSEELGAQLVKNKLDGNEKTVLAEDMPIDVQVIEDWVYYIRQGVSKEDPDANGIFRVKADGSKRERVGKDKALDLLVIGDWIYYKRLTVEDGVQKIALVKCRPDASELTILMEGYFSQFQLSGNLIIFDTSTDNGKYINSMAFDGADKKQLGDDIIMQFLCEGDWIFYTVDETVYMDDEAVSNPLLGLYKINFDGTGRTPITKLEGAVPVNISGEWIYCQNMNEGQQEVFRIKLDGTEKQTLIDHSVWSINVLGQWMYYYDNPVDSAVNVYRTVLGTLYRMDMDLKNTEAVN